jgi:hypothetical protein
MDYLERNGLRTSLNGTNYLIRKITNQKATKKKVLNFITGRAPLRNLSSMLRTSKDRMSVSLATISNKQKITDLEYRMSICNSVIGRIRKLPYIGQPESVIKDNKTDLRSL